MSTEISKIKAEIERRKKEYRNSDNLQDVIRYDTISELLSFIDSLEKERHAKFQEYLKASPAERRKFDLSFLGEPKEEQEPQGLDEAAEEYAKECLDLKFPITDAKLIKADVIYTFKAGAKWMAEQGIVCEAHRGSFGICFERESND